MLPLAVFSLFLASALWAGVTQDLDALIQRNYDRALLRLKGELEDASGGKIPPALLNVEKFHAATGKA